MADTDYSSRLRSAGLRVTAARLALLDQLASACAPASLDELADSCGASGGDRATVYRNLQAFARAGLLSQVRGLGKRDLFELASRGADQPKHAHAVCLECGHIECLDVEGQLPVEQPSSWSHVTPSLTLWGVCEECQEDGEVEG